MHHCKATIGECHHHVVAGCAASHDGRLAAGQWMPRTRLSPQFVGDGLAHPGFCLLPTAQIPPRISEHEHILCHVAAFHDAYPLGINRFVLQP
jgi:hypothetical protein